MIVLVVLFAIGTCSVIIVASGIAISIIMVLIDIPVVILYPIIVHDMLPVHLRAIVCIWRNIAS